jgi:hypothetical protein
MTWQDKVVESDSRKFLWEILVPTEKRAPAGPTSNLYYSTRYHRVWDAKVRELTGGLTIMQPSRGEWVSEDAKLYRERNIPVRIMCTRDQINAIVDMTLAYYDQLAIMAYRISDEVILKHKAS